MKRTLLPLDWDNYQLGSLIPSGATSGTLSYWASLIPSEEPDVSFTEGTARVTFFRHFINGSGADITVKEAGIVAHARLKIITQPRGSIPKEVTCWQDG